MAGDYGLRTFYRAAKADILSLIFFELGLFAWMAIFQIVIFDWQLPMTTVTYWWMMQVCCCGLQVALAGGMLTVARLACFWVIGRGFLSIGG